MPVVAVDDLVTRLNFTVDTSGLEEAAEVTKHALDEDAEKVLAKCPHGALLCHEREIDGVGRVRITVDKRTLTTVGGIAQTLADFDLSTLGEADLTLLTANAQSFLARIDEQTLCKSPSIEAGIHV